MRDVRLDRYPDPDSTELIDALSQHLSIPAELIVAGNGATELIHASARAWGGPDRPVGHCPPTFGEYAAAGLSVGAPILALEQPSSDQSVESFSQASLVFLCHPNNPTGELLSHDNLARILEATAPGVVVVDEAYIQFVAGNPTALPLLERHPNLLIIRSMTKDYGLTALRLGYAMGHPDLSSALRRQLPPWSVNGLAQAAGVAALRDQHHLDVTLDKVQSAKVALVRALERQGWALQVSEANFLLINVGRARDVRARLAPRGLLVRDCQSFGLPTYIRVAVRRPAENRKLVAALNELRASGTLGPDRTKYNSQH
jgi:histidinol-phosphate aminotransferase